jgi:hypothetical protein
VLASWRHWPSESSCRSSGGQPCEAHVASSRKPSTSLAKLHRCCSGSPVRTERRRSVAVPVGSRPGRWGLQWALGRCGDRACGRGVQGTPKARWASRSPRSARDRGQGSGSRPGASSVNLAMSPSRRGGEWPSGESPIHRRCGQRGESVDEGSRGVWTASPMRVECNAFRTRAVRLARRSRGKSWPGARALDLLDLGAQNRRISTCRAANPSPAPSRRWFHVERPRAIRCSRAVTVRRSPQNVGSGATQRLPECTSAR